MSSHFPPRQEFLLPETCRLSTPLKQLPGLLPAHTPGAAAGWKGTYFPETPMALKAPTVLLKTPSSLTSEAARPDPTSAATPRPRIFLPLHFCLKAFSLCEWLSIAFLSSSSQRGGRFSFEPELQGTTGRRRRWKGLRWA